MTIEARTDLERLKRYFDAPAAARTARWVVLPRGIPSTMPGPTDTVLWAFVELPDAAWAELGAPRVPETLEVPAEVAHALWPASAAPAGAQSLTGPAYDVSKRVLNPYRAQHGIRVRDGLLLSLYSH